MGSKRKAGDLKSEREAKRFRCDYSEIITVVVGEAEDAEEMQESKTFFAYKDLLCAHSNFFKIALSGEWTESQNREVHLPEHRADNFKIYLEWVNGGADIWALASTFAVSREREKECLGLLDPGEQPITHILCKLWILADYLQDETFKNQVMDEILQVMDQHSVYCRTIDEVFRTTKSGSALQRYILDTCMRNITLENLDFSRGETSEKFRFALLRRFVEARDSPPGAETALIQDVCRYHEHAKDNASCQRG